MTALPTCSWVLCPEHRRKQRELGSRHHSRKHAAPLSSVDGCAPRCESDVRRRCRRSALQGRWRRFPAPTHSLNFGPFHLGRARTPLFKYFNENVSWMFRTIDSQPSPEERFTGSARWSTFVPAGAPAGTALGEVSRSCGDLAGSQVSMGRRVL